MVIFVVVVVFMVLFFMVVFIVVIFSHLKCAYVLKTKVNVSLSSYRLIRSFGFFSSFLYDAQVRRQK